MLKTKLRPTANIPANVMLCGTRTVVKLKNCINCLLTLIYLTLSVKARSKNNSVELLLFGIKNLYTTLPRRTSAVIIAIRITVQRYVQSDRNKPI